MSTRPPKPFWSRPVDSSFPKPPDTKNNLIVAVKPKLPFKPVFQVAALREGYNIRILNEPLEDSSLFLVETGEGQTPTETTFC